jgi:hypothetical protein
MRYAFEPVNPGRRHFKVSQEPGEAEGQLAIQATAREKILKMVAELIIEFCYTIHRKNSDLKVG